MKVRAALLALAALTGAAPAAADDIPLLGAKLTQVGTFASPVAMAVRTGDTRIFVAEQDGRVEDLAGALILDLSGEVSTGGERGLLGLTFSPLGSHLYVYFTDKPNGRIRVTAFATPGGVVDLVSRRDILTIDHPQFANHKGGAITFGPGGCLYLATGDGGGSGDPFVNGQNLDTLLGKMLRIEPHPERTVAPFYDSPITNPFVSTPGARPEIWAYGLRNPWRFSFDGATGDLWIGDVGQNLWEEVDYRPAAAPGVANYGWNMMEGNHPYAPANPTGATPPNYVPPVYEYAHAGGDCSITGGYVYRGTRIPTLQGAISFRRLLRGTGEGARERCRPHHRAGRPQPRAGLDLIVRRGRARRALRPLPRRRRVPHRSGLAIDVRGVRYPTCVPNQASTRAYACAATCAL